MSFVHLHVHSEYSLLDGLTRIDQLVKKCQATGMPAVAVTDHGNMFGVMRLFDACKKTCGAVKPIFGCEVYVAPKSRTDRKTEVVDDCEDPAGYRDAGYHLVLLAKNSKGFANLSRLVSRAFTEGFYYKPRVDKELLAEYHEGLIALSACLAGEVQARLLQGRAEQADRVACEFREIFGEDFYLEIQNQGLEPERRIIPAQIEMAKKLGIPLVLTNDAHYLNHEDADLHDTLLCIGTKRLKSEPARMRFTGDQFYVKSPEEMARIFPEHPEFMERTLEIADKIENFSLARKPIPPNFPVPEGFTLESYFVDRAKAGFEERIQECRPLWAQNRLKHAEEVYRQRLERELETVIQMGFPGYFLLVWDFIRASREMGVPVGPGRGSAAGSIVAWAMRITDIDPMQYDLLFERFLNPERITMPDVDIDFCRDGRERVIRYVTEKYGQNRVSNIVTINAMKAKAAIKDVARVFEKDFNWANQLTKLVPALGGDDLKTLKDAVEKHDKLKEACDKDPDARTVLDVAVKLEGIARNTGVHAAGVIIAPDDLTEFAPLCVDRDKKVMVQYTMGDAETAGLLKMDFLGLETLTHIAKVQQYITRRHGQPVDMLTIRTFDDPKTFALFAAGDTDGVFQFESGGMKQLLRDLNTNRFEDLIALNALYRPGPLGAGMGKEFVERSQGRAPVVYLLEDLKPILEPTYGIILYQEQVMQIASAIAGYSLGEADLLRRAMGKKKKEIIDKEKEGFIRRAVEKGYPQAKVIELFEQIAYFAGYGFNKSHSAAYALVAYETAYLKANFPAEFMAALLSIKSGRTDDIVKYIQNCREKGIEVLGPDINESDLDFTITPKGRIRFGLAAIKGLGGAALEAILNARRKEGRFRDFFHTLKSTDLQKANKKVWESLIKAGAFDSMEPNRAALLAGLPSAVEMASRGSTTAVGLVSLFGEEDMADFAGSWSLPQDAEPWSRRERLAAEREALGLYVSGHPLEEFKDVLQIHTTGSIRNLEESVKEGRLKDRDEVILGGMVASASIKVNKKNENWALLQLEDLTGRMEVLLMPSLREFGKGNGRGPGIRPFDQFGHLAQPDALLRITGELKIEVSTRGEDEEDEQEVLKIFAAKLEPLEIFQGKGISGALVRLPEEEYPAKVLSLLKENKGNLPLHFEFKTKEGLKATIKADESWKIGYNPDLAERILRETGCQLSWLF